MVDEELTWCYLNMAVSLLCYSVILCYNPLGELWFHPGRRFILYHGANLAGSVLSQKVQNLL